MNRLAGAGISALVYGVNASLYTGMTHQYEHML